MFHVDRILINLRFDPTTASIQEVFLKKKYLHNEGIIKIPLEMRLKSLGGLKVTPNLISLTEYTTLLYFNMNLYSEKRTNIYLSNLQCIVSKLFFNEV